MFYAKCSNPQHGDIQRDPQTDDMQSEVANSMMMYVQIEVTHKVQ